MLPLVQQKTKRKVFVPVHPAWRSAISAVPARAATILYDRHRRPFATPEPIQSALRALMKRIGFAGYTFHGLRKNAANFLAELGLSPHQIGAIAGMSIETVVHYTKGLETRRVSQSVAAKVQGGKMIGKDGEW